MLSIIIPVRNEYATISNLLSSIHTILTKENIEFEIIVVDDYSDDGSYQVVYLLSTWLTSIHVYKKQGEIGKGTTILEGVEHAKGDYLVFIDADLSQKPESILSLWEARSEADIIIADRIYYPKPAIAKYLRTTAFRFFCKYVYGIPFDVQSGLKMVHRSVIEYLEFNPSQWSFDLELILKSLNAGFYFKQIPIVSTARLEGKSKMNPLAAAVEILFLGINLIFNPLQPVTFHSTSLYEKEIGYQGKRFKIFTGLSLNDSAIKTLVRNQLAVIVLFTSTLIYLFITNWHLTLIGLIGVISTLYLIDLLFNLVLIIKSTITDSEIKIPPKYHEYHQHWPIYTVICPLYKEWEIIPQFIKAMSDLDYPKDRLQVLLSLEEDDKKTIEEVQRMTLPEYFHVLITPNAEPKTKPKACNYALLHAKGEFVVIYDAEDMPETSQLKKAVIAFEHLVDKKVICLQAKLNFYNTRQNVLTRLFTLEYLLWFDLVLTGLHAFNAPIPLGGTSNHFRRNALQLLQGWDPFNVTEDCDLGIRLYKHGYRTQVLDSLTLEEANSSFIGWFKQRSRWNKGYMQTYLVHMRRPDEFIHDWFEWHLLTFQLIVGGKILSIWINPLLWTITILYWLLRPIYGHLIESFFPLSVYYMAATSMFFGNFLYFNYYMIAAFKRRRWALLKYGVFIPFYWLMMSVANWIALWQIIIKPHYWEKTKHGLHLQDSEVLSGINQYLHLQKIEEKEQEMSVIAN